MMRLVVFRVADQRCAIPLESAPAAIAQAIRARAGVTSRMEGRER